MPNVVKVLLKIMYTAGFGCHIFGCEVAAHLYMPTTRNGPFKGCAGGRLSAMLSDWYADNGLVALRRNLFLGNGKSGELAGGIWGVG